MPVSLYLDASNCVLKRMLIDKRFCLENHGVISNDRCKKKKGDPSLSCERHVLVSNFRTGGDKKVHCTGMGKEIRCSRFDLSKCQKMLRELNKKLNQEANA